MISCLAKKTRCMKFFCTSIPETTNRDTMEYDVLIVGGGVAGLSTAIKIKQMATQYQRPMSVCLIEKGR
jgi:electron-transferring-flavoprotein dehydrogenase